MFTIDQIKAAHSKVKSGSDFPAYVKEIGQLGVQFYETFVEDGHTNYAGSNGYHQSSSAKYSSLQIADLTNTEKFKKDLVSHQMGQTDYPTFCGLAAASGVYKWTVCLDKMTCTYYDMAENALLVEKIPV